jgi:membrane protein DedA with SNARE-associated domain
VEQLILFLSSLDPLLLYAAVCVIAFMENIFPPSPSDLVIVFAGSLVGMGELGFVPVLLVATTGSTLGFMTMYGIGDWFGARILEKRKISFLPLDTIRKVEHWFSHHGYWIIVGNRFLAGTRAVVSFFAGMSRLKLLPTTLLSFVSALAWNALLVTGGYYLGQNWQRIGFYLSTYSQIVTALVVIAVLVFSIRFFVKRTDGKSRS